MLSPAQASADQTPLKCVNTVAGLMAAEVFAFLTSRSEKGEQQLQMWEPAVLVWPSLFTRVGSPSIHSQQRVVYYNTLTPEVLA